MRYFWLFLVYSQIAFASFFACCLVKEVPAGQGLLATQSAVWIALSIVFALDAARQAVAT